jgi:hypothetical protein
MSIVQGPESTSRREGFVLTIPHTAYRNVTVKGIYARLGRLILFRSNGLRDFLMNNYHYL